jgi:3-demethylubiquinone-9 3-methyltransferase
MCDQAAPETEIAKAICPRPFSNRLVRNKRKFSRRSNLFVAVMNEVAHSYAKDNAVCGSTATPRKQGSFTPPFFGNSRILQTTHYGEAGSRAAGRPQGWVMTITFQLNRQEFMALNGGSHLKFTPAISLRVNCDTQAEIDEYWNIFLQEVPRNRADGSRTNSACLADRPRCSRGNDARRQG